MKIKSQSHRETADESLSNNDTNFMATMSIIRGGKF